MCPTSEYKDTYVWCFHVFLYVLLQSKIEKLKAKVEGLENERDALKESEQLMEERVSIINSK